MEHFATNVVPVLWGIGLFFGGILVVGFLIERHKDKKYLKNRDKKGLN